MKSRFGTRRKETHPDSSFFRETVPECAKRTEFLSPAILRTDTKYDIEKREVMCDKSTSKLYRFQVNFQYRKQDFVTNGTIRDDIIPAPFEP